jgi:hypothetical protein
MKTKFAIGCLVQWFESDMIEDYVDSLKDAIASYDGEVLVDLMFSKSKWLEKPILTDDELDNLQFKVYNMFQDLQRIRDGVLVFVNSTVSNYSIADYRREFNDKFCNHVDVLVWGESDMLVPKQSFIAIDSLHQQVSNQSPKYLATFGICKMWDSSWKILEHPEFTDKPFIEGDSKNWWNIPYVMSKEEMNSFNDKVTELDVNIVSPHKFNGCGLVISSEVIKSGVNIPKSVFFIHEDTAFMLMTQKVLGNIPQYHFSNILVVHNRKHLKKRLYIKGEESFAAEQLDQKRKSNDWYLNANKMSSENCYNLFNPLYKSYTWEDVWN